jgi:hypothetical protein
MINNALRRVAVSMLAAIALLGGGLPALTGTAHAATVTVSPSTVANDAVHTFTISNVSAAATATSVTLTDHARPTNTISGTIENKDTVNKKITAKIDTLNRLPSKYDLEVGGVITDTCTECVTLTGLPPGLDLTAPPKIAAGVSQGSPIALHLSNPKRGFDYAKTRMQLTFSGIPGLKAADLELTDPATDDDIALAPGDAGTIVGYVGPAAGTHIPPNFDDTTPLTLRVVNPARLGTLHIEAAFGDVDAGGALATVRASDSVNVTVGKPGLTYHPVSPKRLLDTRNVGGAIPAGGTRTLSLGTVPGTALLFNLTATGATTTGFLTVYPSDQPAPVTTASNLLYRSGRSIANLVAVPLGANKGIIIRNGGTAPVHAVVDMSGYYTPATVAGSTYHPFTPTRFLDTRTVPADPFLPGELRLLTVAGRSGVPTSASAIAVNVTAVAATASGYLNVFPGSSQTEPLTSTVNFPAGRTVPNLTVVPLGGTPGKIAVVNHSQGNTHVVLDLLGYFTNDDSGSTFHPLVITRTLDTRFGVGATQGTVAPKGSITLQVSGRTGVPANGATLVALNVAVINPTAGGYLLAYPEDVGKPTASTVNFVANENASNLTLLRLPSSGRVTIYNGSLGTIHVAADVEGWGSTP